MQEKRGKEKRKGWLSRWGASYIDGGLKSVENTENSISQRWHCFQIRLSAAEERSRASSYTCITS